MEEKTTKCPLTRHAEMGKLYEKVIFDDCIKEKCEWWRGANDHCIIHTLADIEYEIRCKE